MVICDRQMKLQTDEACAFYCCISVLPPPSRKLSEAPGGLEPSSITGRSHTAYSCCNNYSSHSRREFCSSTVSSLSLRNPQDEALTNEEEVRGAPIIM